ncbi:MAG: asparagine synthase (glutamine-hydrolyzing) [Rhodospirillaceae bacterium]|nr:asparagine synthase (glutamine-hydrolyzing) [Rhodospirillaceae bacterium]|tara:strand:+ start:12109 stop:14016 length:1908 start_codon:yes stop_codon:yes gene_type:complete
MCGIAGIIAKREIHPAAISSMTDLMEHRGPDGEGEWRSESGTIVLGHRRLAIIDPTQNGAQPMPDPTGQAVITFNGEIYNYLEIAQNLAAEGVNLYTKSDTEVLLASYMKWGNDCLRHFNGMFAFAIYDRRKNKVFCARDRFGEKPFLFARTNEMIAFASEYKALLPLKGINAEQNDALHLRFLLSPREGLDDGRQTIFTDIDQLLPGEMAEIDVDTLGIEISRYWDILPNADYQNFKDADAINHFRDLLTDSIKIRLRSDVPVGSCLSGGLDSSSIVCVSNQLRGPNDAYHTFTGHFPQSNKDELPFAEKVISHTGVISHLTKPTGAMFLSDLDQFMWDNELPVGSTSQYAQWRVFKEAKKHEITVLLDGQGADELLAGYEQYFNYYLRTLDNGDPAKLANEKEAIQERYPLALNDTKAQLKEKAPVLLRWYAAQILNRGSDTLFGISKEYLSHTKSSANFTIPKGFNALSSILYEDTFKAHLPTLLRYGDRNSMAHSREVRLPFCDHRIAEFALNLSPKTHMGDAQTKRLLRRAMTKILPEEIRIRWNKQGFLPPQDDWFSDELKGLVNETIANPTFQNRNYWNVPWWNKCLERFNKGEIHLAWTLWRPVISEAWQTRFVDRAKSLPRIEVFA